MDTFPIVGVASSAGDFAAVSELLSALPAECGAALIIVQHLDSGRERFLLEALAKKTILPVMHAHDGAVVEHDRVYVITANHADYDRWPHSPDTQHQRIALFWGYSVHLARERA